MRPKTGRGRSIRQYLPIQPARPRALPPPWLGLRGTVDGYRMLAYRDGARVRLMSRNGVDHARRYPGVAVAVARA